jgi:hypothetical protein
LDVVTQLEVSIPEIRAFQHLARVSEALLIGELPGEIVALLRWAMVLRYEAVGAIEKAVHLLCPVIYYI